MKALILLFVVFQFGFAQYKGGNSSGYASSTASYSINTSVDTRKTEKKDFLITSSYPNPFNPSTTISFNIAESGNVKVTIYQNTGELVKELCNNYYKSGNNTINFSGDNYSSGVYFTVIEYFNKERNTSARNVIKLLLLK